MSWKIKAAAVLTFFSSAFGMKAREVPSESEPGDSIKKEIITHTPVAEKVSAPFSKVFAAPDSVAQNKLPSDTLPRAKVHPDSLSQLSADTIAAGDSIVCDSLSVPADLAKFKAAEYDMLCLIAHCEGVKVKAYWDPYGKVYTIGIGNTVRPDGKPVRKWDKITDEQELMKYFSAHVEKFIYEPMSEVLNMEKMSSPELVALTSFFYNCGVGCLRRYSKTEKKYVPTKFAKDLNELFETHSDESKAKVKAYMDKRVTSGYRTLPQLVKRRDLEQRILFGDIILNNQGTLTEENALDFSEIPLGGVYSIGSRLPADTLELCKRLSKITGKNLNDSIQSQFPQKQMQQIMQNKKRSR